MKVSDFSFDLPEALIAKYPPKQRGDSRLLCLDMDNGELDDRHFSDVLGYLEAGDVLVFNNTRVIPARLFARKESGGKLEILFERRLSDQRFLAHVRSSRSPKPGSLIYLEDETELRMLGREGALFELELPSGQEVFDTLGRLGHVPLPPYIDRSDEKLDGERYQTVYAEHPGSSAAPTAGLHFTEALLEAIRAKGVEIAYVTLHVGAGTFQPVKVEDVKDHVMHSEWIDVPESVVNTINGAKKRGGRVFAVGTTSCRSLESASSSGALQAMKGETDIFIYPSYQFKTVDALITNFHLPQSTLLMLVSALAGQENILNAYQHAIAQQYRFFSYGDAMLIHRNTTAHPNSRKS